MWDAMTLSMSAEINRYSSAVPSALSWNLTWPTARVSWPGTSFDPVRCATKFFPSGVLAAWASNVARSFGLRSEEHTSELQSRLHLVCRLLLEKKKTKKRSKTSCLITRDYELVRA